MRPLKLEFEGINSFSEHTVIDFERLIKGGIFGIFGDTGSGKSTILDCINFALYGRIERSKEKNDIINYRCNAATVKFTFDIVNCGRRRKYYIERTIKNNKSGTHNAELYEDGVCIARQAQEVEKKVVEILGVRADDFRKCIALPQGEFARFVKSAPGERVGLIERLFSLSVYGNELRDKIAARIKDLDEEFSLLTGRLDGYNDVSEEIINALAAQISDIKTRTDGVDKELANASAQLEKIKALSEKRREAEQINLKLEKLTAKKPEIEELRKEITILPACREAADCLREVSDAENQIKQTDQRLKEVNEKISSNEATIGGLEKKLAEGNFESRIEDLTVLVAKYQTCAGKPQKLVELKAELDRKRSLYKNLGEQAAGIYDDINGYTQECAELEKKLGPQNSDNLGNLVNIEFKGAVLRNEYLASLEYFYGLKDRLDVYSDGSELYTFIINEINEQINLYRQRIAYVKDFSLEDVNRQFEVLQAAMKEREANAELLRKLTQKLNETKSRAERNAHNLETLKEDGAEIRKRTDELEAELSAVFGENCGDYAAAEKSARIQLEAVKSEQRALLKRIEECKALRGELHGAESKLKEAALHLEERRKEKLAKCEELVKKSGLENISACVAHAEKFAGIADAEREVKEFDQNFAVLTARYAELKAIEGLDGATFEVLKAAQDNKSALEQQKNELLQTLAVAEEKLGATKNKLQEKIALNAQFNRVKKDRDLVYQLRDLTKNNKFIEFIADEYLYDISAMASVTLLKLTDGRYYLTYKDNNFNVGDNFDCGNLRGVNTLSGGETFIVSLSLALALSQTICSRSMKSIEFFFLDEGFGTLDSALLDTVMSALEKLKSSNFTIGIISHVEELKHRIDNKIIVQKATESHGSTVQISC